MRIFTTLVRSHRASPEKDEKKRLMSSQDRSEFTDQWFLKILVIGYDPCYLSSGKRIKYVLYEFGSLV